jgi:hypothetical protein
LPETRDEQSKIKAFPQISIHPHLIGLMRVRIGLGRVRLGISKVNLAMEGRDPILRPEAARDSGRCFTWRTASFSSSQTSGAVRVQRVDRNEGTSPS